MASDIARSRFMKLSKAIKAVNTVDGIVNAEIAEINAARALVFVKRESSREFIDQCRKRVMYPFLIEGGEIMIFSVRINQEDQPIFAVVD